MLTTTLVTADELLDYPDDYRCELIRGVVVEVSPAFWDHDALVGLLIEELVVYNVRTRVGMVRSGDGGYILEHDPDTVLAPDIAVVRREQSGRPPRGTHSYVPFPPLLAVEVKSPSNSERRIVEKTDIYLAAGVGEVWWVRPTLDTITRSTPDGGTTVFGRDDMLTSTVLPEFALSLADFFGE